MDCNHFLVALLTGLVALLCTALGAAFGAKRPALALVCGWGCATITLTLFGTLTPIRLDWVMAALALISLIMSRHLLKLDWRYAWPVVALGLPYLFIASLIMPVGFDEYSHWLPNILYLDRYNHFPTLLGPESASIRPGYPYGLAFVALAVSRICGTVAETAVINWNALLNLALASMACELLVRFAKLPHRWRCAAIAVLGCGVLSPVFVSKLYLSNYGDAICGQIAGIIVAAILLNGVALRRWQEGIQLGLAAAALVAIRQDALSIVAIISVSWALIFVWQNYKNVSAHSIFVWVIAGAIPALEWALWQHYQSTQISQGAAGLLPWHNWRWHDLPAIFHSILVIFSHKIGYALVLLLTFGVGVFGWRLPPKIRTAALFGCLLGLGHIASMVCIYLVAITGGESVRKAPEFWRFSQHIAPAIIVCALPCLLLIKFPMRVQKTFGPLLPVFTILILCVAYPFLRVDHVAAGQPSYEWLRTVAHDVSASLPQNAQLTLMETNEPAGEIQEVFCLRYRYLALRPDATPSDITQIGGTPPQTVVIEHSLPVFESFTALPPQANYVLVTNGSALNSTLMGTTLPTGKAYLLHKNADSSFSIIRSWVRSL